MNPNVIEAAVAARGEAWKTLSDEDCTIERAERHLTRAAITAALRELAPEIRTAVRMLSGAAQHYVDAGWRYGETDERTEQAADGVMAARRDLLALLGIEDAIG